jgi:hypothetical protein
MNWTKILKDAGIPESPGYRETIESFVERPYEKPIKKAKKPKGRPKKALLKSP